MKDSIDPCFLKSICISDESDVVYREESMRLHPDEIAVKVGCVPVSVKREPIPEPVVACYVRATEGKRQYWYVLNWLQRNDSGQHQEILVESEEEAKLLVFKILKAAYRNI